MKKIFSLIITVLLSLSLCLTACGGETGVSGTISPNEDSASENNTPAEEQGESISDEPAESENELSLGRMEGGIYTNNYVGYACSLDSNWTFMSAEELDQLPDDVFDMFSGSELYEQISDVQQFTDMMAENVTDLTTMNVGYQKLGLQEKLAYAVMSEEEVIDAVLAQSDLMIEAYEQIGMVVDSMEKVTVNFMGEDRFAVYTSSTLYDVPYYVLQFYDTNLGEYSVVTTLGSYVEDKTSDLCDLFYKVEK